jgi:hypothetical protein
MKKTKIIKDTNILISKRLPVIILKQWKGFVVYSHVLDISAIGEDIEEAKRNFQNSAASFFEELIESKNLEDNLIWLGWRKINGKWEAPQLISAINLDIEISNNSIKQNVQKISRMDTSKRKIASK